jgi:hypothetical protein
MELPAVIEPEPLKVNIHIVKVNNKLGLQIRKTFSLCDKNLVFLNELIKASFDNKPITSKVLIEFNDKFKAQLKLKELGFKV